MKAGRSAGKAHKKSPEINPGVVRQLLSALFFGGKAFAAVNRTIIARFEGYLGGYAALGTDGFVHFPGCPGVAAFPAAPTCIAAVTAAGRFVLEALFGIEFLLSGRKDEVSPAVFAL
jgi:hypothetical protein